MLYLYEFRCDNQECDLIFEEFVDQENGVIKGMPLCPECSSKAQLIISNPKHSTHVSWSQWKVGHGH